MSKEQEPNKESNVEQESNEEKELKFEKESNMELLEQTDKKLDAEHNKKMRINFIALITLFTSIALVASYFISPLSKVEKISIHGNNGVVAQEVLAASELKINQRLYDVRGNEKTIAKKVETNKQIKKAEVKLVRWNEVEIHVKEFKTVAYLSNGEAYRRVLENGVILEEESIHTTGNYPIINDFEEGKALDQMIKELDKIDENILNMISEIELMPDHPNPMFVQVYMNNGNRVLASIPEFSEKMAYYPQMIQAVDNKKGIFDMEVGVYFIPFSKSENKKGEEEYDVDDEGEYYVDEEEAYELDSVGGEN